MSDFPSDLGVLTKFDLPEPPETIVSLGNSGGFSGARFWRIQTLRQTLCLRRWPKEHPSPQQLQQTHRVIQHAANRGLDWLPVPFVTRQGQSFASFQGHLWELTNWLPGKPMRVGPAGARDILPAMEALASFHNAAESVPAISTSSRGVSPGLQNRLRAIVDWQTRGWDTTPSVYSTDKWPEINVSRLLDCFQRHAAELQRALTNGCRISVNLQPVIRDARHEHILLTSNRVTGLVDFGAMRIETVACDVARLLQTATETCGGRWWNEGVEAYRNKRVLSDAELQLVPIFAQSGLLLGGLNWLKWLFLDGRQFEDRIAVTRRVNTIIEQLERLP